MIENEFNVYSTDDNIKTLRNRYFNYLKRKEEIQKIQKISEIKLKEEIDLENIEIVKLKYRRVYEIIEDLKKFKITEISENYQIKLIELLDQKEKIELTRNLLNSILEKSISSIFIDNFLNNLGKDSGRRNKDDIKRLLVILKFYSGRTIIDIFHLNFDTPSYEQVCKYHP